MVGGGAGASFGSGSPNRLGVLGTLVWDRIVDETGGAEVVEEWGGISYSLEGFAAALPEDWVAQPLLKVGQDRSEEALEYVGTLPRTEVQPGICCWNGPNPTVELRYRGQARISERLRGAPPPWSWEELAPLLSGVDALFINFITGQEMGLDTALKMAEEFSGPVYTDLHSLFLGISPEGFRFPRELPEWRRWLGAFHAVQMNEGEFRLLGGPREDSWRLAADEVGEKPRLIAVTLGNQGAAYVVAPDFSPDPGSWMDQGVPCSSETVGSKGQVGTSEPALVLDPTGCGDVWGATFFARLLAGCSLEAAMKRANAAAARNAAHRGARELYRHLSGLTGS
jgi:sugar/nucleoside kinase (ribokinase family)